MVYTYRGTWLTCKGGVHGLYVRGTWLTCKGGVHGLYVRGDMAHM